MKDKVAHERITTNCYRLRQHYGSIRRLDLRVIELEKTLRLLLDYQNLIVEVPEPRLKETE